MLKENFEENLNSIETATSEEPTNIVQENLNNTQMETSHVEEEREIVTDNFEPVVTDRGSAENFDSETLKVDGVNYPYKNDAGKKRPSWFKRFVKRLFDFTSSFTLFLFLNVTLIFPILMILVAIKMKGNPFFSQARPGLNGKIIKIYKFRSMTNETDADGNLLPDEVRLTRFGKWLRDSSLDELPGLLNIIAGQVSVVGPRPHLVIDMTFYSEDAYRRQSVKPGLTGLAQISGRNNIGWEEKFAYDLEYIDKMGFFYDLGLIFKTVGKVLKKEDISTEGLATHELYGDYLLRVGAIDKEFYDTRTELAKEMLKDFYTKH